MSTTVEYIYSKEEAAELREAIIRDYVKPIVEEAFEKYPQLNSAMLLVAQYWSHEANDTIHYLLVFSALETLDIEVVFKSEFDPQYDPQYIDPINWSEPLPDPDQPIRYTIRQSIEEEDEDEEEEAKMIEVGYSWKDKEKAVPAFAAFCKEGYDYDTMVLAAYSPYAILRRRGEEVEREVIGEMLRPWVDGVKQYEYIYSSEEVANLREELMHDRVMPVVKNAFDKYPQLKSAMLLVAQYWDDEANDAVHDRLFFSVLETLNIETVWKLNAEAIWKKERHGDPLNIPGLQIELYEDENDEYFWGKIYWGDNGKAIPAFAAFCKEACNQLMSISEAYSPYAILQCKGEEIEIEVIGEMVRPWLDGIKHEWYEGED